MINLITLQITPIIQKPEPVSIQHIENLERIGKRRAKVQRHIDAACFDRMGQKRNHHKQAMLVNLVVWFMAINKAKMKNGRFTIRRLWKHPLKADPSFKLLWSRANPNFAAICRLPTPLINSEKLTKFVFYFPSRFRSCVHKSEDLIRSTFCNPNV